MKILPTNFFFVGFGLDLKKFSKQRNEKNKFLTFFGFHHFKLVLKSCKVEIFKNKMPLEQTLWRFCFTKKKLEAYKKDHV